jgi:hypothetical protein
MVGNWLDQIKFQEMYFYDVITIVILHQAPEGNPLREFIEAFARMPSARWHDIANMMCIWEEVFPGEVRW